MWKENCEKAEKYKDKNAGVPSVFDTPAFLMSRTVIHKTSGKGVIKKFDGTVLTVKFQNGETKTFNYDICLEKQLLQIDEVTT